MLLHLDPGGWEGGSEHPSPQLLCRPRKTQTPEAKITSEAPSLRCIAMLRPASAHTRARKYREAGAAVSTSQGQTRSWFWELRIKNCAAAETKSRGRVPQWDPAPASACPGCRELPRPVCGWWGGVVEEEEGATGMNAEFR